MNPSGWAKVVTASRRIETVSFRLYLLNERRVPELALMCFRLWTICNSIRMVWNPHGCYGPVFDFNRSE
jgi:hypothetical protein